MQEYDSIDVQDVSLTKQTTQSHHNFVGHKVMLHNNLHCLTFVLHSSWKDGLSWRIWIIVGHHFT